jgi:hypothetical protein
MMGFIVFGGAALVGLLLALLLRFSLSRTPAPMRGVFVHAENEMKMSEAEFSRCDGGLRHTVASDPLYRIDGDFL